MRARLLQCFPLALFIVACGETPCDPPTGCLRADRVDGTCQCLEWQLASIKPVPVKYVVVGVDYPPLGTQSVFGYGYDEAVTSGGVTTRPATAAAFGSRWRSVIRAADGSEHVATLGPIDVGSLDYATGWRVLAPITGTSATLVEVSEPPPANGLQARWLSSPVFDVLARGADGFHLWINPEVAVAADYAGGRSVAWSSPGAVVPYPPGAVVPYVDVQYIEAGFLDGSFPPPTNPRLLALLDLLDAVDRAAILEYDPFYRDPSTIPGDPRFQLVSTVAFDSGWSRPVVSPVAWKPCAGVLGDADFSVLAQSAEIPYGAGETFTLEHSVLSSDAACMLQQPGLMVGTSTPGCSIETDVYVDRAFGSLLMLPKSVSAACTKP